MIRQTAIIQSKMLVQPFSAEGLPLWSGDACGSSEGLSEGKKDDSAQNTYEYSRVYPLVYFNSYFCVRRNHIFFCIVSWKLHRMEGFFPDSDPGTLCVDASFAYVAAEFRLITLMLWFGTDSNIPVIKCTRIAQGRGNVVHKGFHRKFN